MSLPCGVRMAWVLREPKLDKGFEHQAQHVGRPAERTWLKILNDPTHRPLSSSFLWFMFKSYKVLPKRNYLGAYG